MHRDYGYMEDGALGSSDNFRLMKRLVSYGVPYKKKVFIALSLSILLTLSALAIPYLSKIAIDRYIRSSWYGVDMTLVSATGQGKDLLTRYGHLLNRGLDPSFAFISHPDMNKIDPDDLHHYKTRGILTTERFYRTESEHQIADTTLAGNNAIIQMADGSGMVSYSLLEGIPKTDILKIRAGDINGVMIVAILLVVLIIIASAFNYGEYYLLAFIGQHIMQDIRVQLFHKIQFNALSFFDRNPVGRLVTRVTNDIANLDEMFRSVVITIFKDFLILIGVLAILLYLDWRLSLLCFALIPIVFGFTMLLSAMARDAFRALREAVAKINAFLQERIAGMRVIQLFVRESLQMKSFASINHENYLAGMKQIRVFAVFMPVMEFFSSFAVAILIWYGGAKVMEDQLSLGTLVAFISYLQMFFKPIRDISEKYNIMQSAMASTERIFEFMDHKEEIPEPDVPQTPSEKRGHLVFENVSFDYKEGQPVLRDVSFEVKPGETVAVVGATGAGKTTLVNLIARFYDPSKGSVILDGVDLRKWSTSELHRNTGLCMQDVFIFSGSLVDNISLGRGQITDKAVELAAARANALSFIRRLENDFHQELGESGCTLSSGQRQLLSFARALASDPNVLILDEATSSVDPETERLIQEAISRISATTTTLIVAHRLSTVRRADRILVMHKGRIKEQGTHEALMSLRGLYYKLNRFRKSQEI